MFNYTGARRHARVIISCIAGAGVAGQCAVATRGTGVTG